MYPWYLGFLCLNNQGFLKLKRVQIQDDLERGVFGGECSMMAVVLRSRLSAVINLVLRGRCSKFAEFAIQVVGANIAIMF